MSGELEPLESGDGISSPIEIKLSSADDVDSDKLFDRLRLAVVSFAGVLL